MRIKMKKIVIIIGVLLIVGGYFGYKAFNLLVRYNFHDYGESFSLKIVGSKHIDFHQEIDEGYEYFQLKNMKVRNDFKEFQFLSDASTDEHLKYRLNDEDGNRKAAVMIGVGPTYVEILKKGLTIFSSDNKNINDDDLSVIEDFLNDNGINNDIQLFEYIIEHKDDKSNIFTSTKKMRDNYILYYLMYIMLPSNFGITIIDGIYDGYIFELNNGIKEVSILYHDKKYVFTFIGSDYFTEEYIYEILGTFVIDSSVEELNDFEGADNVDTFVKTYTVIDIIENNSLEYDSFEVKKFQDEESVVINISKEFSNRIEKNKSYEFIFEKNVNINIEDNIRNVFENFELIDVVLTDKVGLEQIQD